MTIDPAPPQPPQRDVTALIKVGTLAFFSVCVVIAWVVAANYDPREHAAALQKEKPSPTVIIPTNTLTATDLLVEDTALPLTVNAQTELLPAGTPASPTIMQAPGAPGSPPTVTPAVTDSNPPQQDNGTSADDPILPGTTVAVGDSITLTVLGGLRPANDIVIEIDPSILPLDPGYEYMQLELRITCTKPSSQNCFFSPYELMIQGADDFIYGIEPLLEGLDGVLEEGEYAGGSTRTGLLFFIIPINDPTLIMYYESFMLPMDIIYFALP